MEFLEELLSFDTSAGCVRWLGMAPQKRGPMAAPDAFDLVEGSGIVGDHHFRTQNKSKRQVTLIQHEYLAIVEALLHRQAGSIEPSLLRRNIVVSGINLAALRHTSFRIGTAVLRGTGDCPPCSRMEANLGTGGYTAMLGHGGITAIVVCSGRIAVGDSVEAVVASGR